MKIKILMKYNDQKECFPTSNSTSENTKPVQIELYVTSAWFFFFFYQFVLVFLKAPSSRLEKDK